MKKKSERAIIRVVIATGISSVVTQLLIIREFLAQFQGNDTGIDPPVNDPDPRLVITPESALATNPDPSPGITPEPGPASLLAIGLGALIAAALGRANGSAAT